MRKNDGDDQAHWEYMNTCSKYKRGHKNKVHAQIYRTPVSCITEGGQAERRDY